MKPTKTDVTLSIGEVSKLVGVSPGMLRTWESEGLFMPGRTIGGHRLFRSNDIRRLRRVAKLFFEDKLNPAAIRRELGPVADNSADLNAVDSSLGEKLRSIRTRQSLTLTATAAKSGLSASFISSLERGNTGVSVEALFRLCEAIGTTLPSLRATDEDLNTQKHFVPQSKRNRFITDDGLLTIEDLIPKPARMEAQISLIAPGKGSDGVFSHKGQEFLLILEGQLSFWLEPGDFYALKTGDTLYLHSHLEHSWKNEGATATRVLWVNAALPADKESASEVAQMNVNLTPVSNEPPLR